MQYDKKAIAQQLLQQIINKDPINKDQIKETVIRVGVQAAARFLHYHSMKGLYTLRKRINL
jgi:hypothetical protein